MNAIAIPVLALLLMSACAGMPSVDDEYAKADERAAYIDKFKIDRAACAAAGGRIEIERSGGLGSRCRAGRCPPGIFDVYRCVR